MKNPTFKKVKGKNTMQRPYCIIDGVRHQLHMINDVIRFPDDNRPMPDLNKAIIDYAEGKAPLSDMFDYAINSGSSYEYVRGIYSHDGCNNHIVTQGKENTKSFKLYR